MVIEGGEQLAVALPRPETDKKGGIFRRRDRDLSPTVTAERINLGGWRKVESPQEKPLPLRFEHIKKVPASLFESIKNSGIARKFSEVKREFGTAWVGANAQEKAALAACIPLLALMHAPLTLTLGTAGALQYGPWGGAAGTAIGMATDAIAVSSAFVIAYFWAPPSFKKFMEANVREVKEKGQQVASFFSPRQRGF